MLAIILAISDVVVSVAIIVNTIYEKKTKALKKIRQSHKDYDIDY